MEVTFEVYTSLIQEIKDIRTMVFVFEQGFNDEFDETDNNAVHILLVVDDVPAGTARIIFNKKHQLYSVTRVAILSQYRHLGLGKELMNYVEQEIIKRYGHVLIGVSAQSRVEEFYTKLGYNATEERYLDESCPHVWMIKQL